MKVIFISRECYEFPGGRIRSYEFSEELKKRGIDTSFFFFIDNKKEYLERDILLREKIILTFKSLPYFLRQRNCIFVVNRFNYHSLCVWLVSLFKKIPYVFDMDDWEYRENVGKYFGIFPKSKSEYLSRIFAHNSRFCIAASHYLKDYLSQFNKKVYLIPTGIDTNLFKPKHNCDKKEVIFSWHGLINRKEIVDYLKFVIECFIIVNREIKHTQLWIKGTGIFIKDFLEILKNYRNENIKYFRWSHPLTIPSYLDKVDIGLFPLLEKTHFNLAKFPVKVVEYMAKKIPVIASNMGEVKYIIKHNYNGFLANSKEEFVDYMLKLTKDRFLREKIGKNAYETVKEKYSLSLLGGKLYKIFKENFEQL